MSWYAPHHLDEALALLARRPHMRLVAGGTDIMVGCEAHAEGSEYLSLSGVGGLRGIRETPAGVTIGALTTMTEIGQHPAVCRDLPALAASARATGAVAIQNRATLGGNIMNASPAADNAPALLAYGASVVLMSAGGSRHVPYERFHEGYKATARRPGEILGEIFVPFPRHRLVIIFARLERGAPRPSARWVSRPCWPAPPAPGSACVSVSRVWPRPRSLRARSLRPSRVRLAACPTMRVWPRR
nr:FAD binding domain-containing protein [Acidiferrobacter thiooxydans]